MKRRARDTWEELELGFGGGTKFRVLAHLMHNHKEAFTKYSLTKATGLRTPSVESYLRTLLELGWIKEFPFTPTTYQINLENAFVRQIFELFQRLRHPDTPP